MISSQLPVSQSRLCVPIFPSTCGHDLGVRDFLSCSISLYHTLTEHGLWRLLRVKPARHPSFLTLELSFPPRVVGFFRFHRRHHGHYPGCSIRFGRYRR